MLQRIILTILSYNLKKDWCYQKNEINVIKISLEKNSTSKLTFNIETARFPSPKCFVHVWTLIHLSTHCKTKVLQQATTVPVSLWKRYIGNSNYAQDKFNPPSLPSFRGTLPDTRPRTIVTGVSDGRKVEDRCLTREKSFFWEITAAFRSSNLLPENR